MNTDTERYGYLLLKLAEKLKEQEDTISFREWQISDLEKRANDIEEKLKSLEEELYKKDELLINYVKGASR